MYEYTLQYLLPKLDDIFEVFLVRENLNAVKIFVHNSQQNEFYFFFQAKVKAIIFQSKRY